VLNACDRLAYAEYSHSVCMCVCVYIYIYIYPGAPKKMSRSLSAPQVIISYQPSFLFFFPYSPTSIQFEV
jgi:hypothetical protein